MTTVLLDTHALVWAVGAPERLGEEAARLLRDPATDVLVSAATAWEVATKVRIGRFPEAELLAAQFEQTVRTLGAELLPISAEHALRAGGLRWLHKDPFDRMLAAQALLEHATLLTIDVAFADLGGLSIAW